MVDINGIARRHPRLTAVGAIIAVGVVLSLYYLIGPSSGLYPRCPFRMLTGLDCPGCGSQRALHALLHGDIASAWRCNALLVAGLPVVALLVSARALRHSHPALERTLNSQGIILILLIVIVLWTIIRNII